jgi:hypothetical protein
MIVTLIINKTFSIRDNIPLPGLSINSDEVSQDQNCFMNFQ